ICGDGRGEDAGGNIVQGRLTRHEVGVGLRAGRGVGDHACALIFGQVQVVADESDRPVDAAVVVGGADDVDRHRHRVTARTGDAVDEAVLQAAGVQVAVRPHRHTVELVVVQTL